MPNTGKYVININVASEDSGAAQGNQPTAPQGSSGGQGARDFSSLKKFSSMAKTFASAALVKDVFSYHLSIVGVRSGNSDLQDKINFGTQAAGALIGVGSAFAIGGALGGTIAIAGLAFNALKSISEYEYNKGWADVATEQARYRAGSSINRSRG